MKKLGMMVLLILGVASLCFADAKIFGFQAKGKTGGVISFMTISDGVLAEQTNQSIPTVTRQGNSAFCNIASDEGKSSAVMVWTAMTQSISEGKAKIKGGTDLSGGNATEEVEITVITLDGTTGKNSERKITDLTEATLFATEFFGE